jgi:hypothetical protein
MIKPTIGRVVWFHPSGSKSSDQPNAALIAYVHSDTMVNLAVFDCNGQQSGQTSVFLWQGDTERPSSYYCEWMPYQQRAAITEALEKQLAAKQEGCAGSRHWHGAGGQPA